MRARSERTFLGVFVDVSKRTRKEMVSSCARTIVRHMATRARVALVESNALFAPPRALLFGIP